MRVLIVDDEAPARARLRQLLASQPDVEIAGEAETGIQAMELAAGLRPALILLDIQMPGCSGIDVAACLPPPRPQIVFCTAFDQYAVDAFELHAVDYLLKPISRARLAQALERARVRARDLSGDLSLAAGREAALDGAARHRRAAPARFLARTGSRYLVVGEARVLYFASEQGLTRLIAGDAQYWMDPSLNDLEKRLDPARFFRISRAALINLNAVTEIVPLPGGSGEVALKNGARLEVSRRRYRDLLQALAGMSWG